ncbi:uncharacterized protein CDAR_538321 [Caerostris darwini]|uniref:LolA-like domain-containing protein n=1 Tax=Caerostris darwini TaxID=1538125 RepID=A0AAV4UCM7_9ARAC|nr:uncharacterized protein CDAR_538321 [Caerostris darwini]
MRNFILIQKWTILIFVILTVLQETRCDPHFTCPTMDGEDVPELPNYYTTHVRLNYFDQQKTVDVRQVVSKNEDGHKTAVEFSADQRHVKYIHYDNQLLIVTFYSDKNPTCVVKDTSSLDKFLEDEDAGPNMILSKLVSVVEGPLRSQLKISDVFNENGVSGRKWEGCFKNPEINVSLSFTENVWKQGHTSRLHKGKYIVSAEAQIDKNYLVALFNYFDPVMPADTEFQPPENVYCEGFRKDKKPPSMPNYFSYDSEVISYRSSMGVAPISTHLTVYYDYPAGIARSDFYDALAEDQDMFSEVSAKGISIIHDFNAGIQYLVDPIIGSCTIDEMEATISPADVQVTGDNKMPTGMEFFSLNVKGISYNGQFETRGYTADVYTALVETTINDEKKKLIYSWYFSTDLVDIVEKESVEKKVLLRMVVQPEATELEKHSELGIGFPH